MLEVESLRRVSIFSELPSEQLELIFRIVQLRLYSAGSLVFREGEPGDAICFVSSGRVKISTISTDGREKIIRFMDPGQVFGEVVLFESGPYPATATAVDESEIGILQNRDLFRLLLEHGELTVSLLKLLSRRLRMAQSQLRDLALKDAFTRVGELVLSLAEQSGQASNGGVMLQLTETREELANLAGTSRETFSRMLSELRQQGLVLATKGGLFIPDMDRLRLHLS